MSTTYGRRLLISVDAAGYGLADDHRQHAMQVALLGALERAAERAGLERSGWDRQSAGDSELAVLPADAQAVEPALIDDFTRELSNALNEYNRYMRDEVRLRLRLAVHFGVVVKDENGFSGQGPVVVSRLVDSTPVKQVLAGISAANLVVVLSRTVFTDAVAQGHTALGPRSFRAVRVRNKEFDDDAYLYVPGHDITAVRLSDDSPEPFARQTPAAAQRKPAREREGADRPMMTSIGTFQGNVTVKNGNIGSTWNQS